MIWLELRTNNTIYDSGWNFSESVWAPTKKANGSNWPFWNLVSNVTKGDLVFHIIKRNGVKKISGYSTALTDGYLTKSLPSSNKHVWNYSQTFYKVDLTDYQELNPSIPLAEFFKNNDTELREYFETNKAKKRNKKRLFYVIQSKRLQCQNGAYFSELDNHLASEITNVLSQTRNELTLKSKAETDEVIKELKQRIGHQEFSENVKLNFNYKCCYPGCNVNGKGFLVSGHITRWSDNKDLRGNTDNGLCLCLMHDKAFEKGLFTLDEKHKVILLKNKFENISWLFSILIDGENLEIKPRGLDPSLKALKDHWTRIGYNKK